MLQFRRTLKCEHGHEHVVEYADGWTRASVEDHHARAHGDGCFTEVDGRRCGGRLAVETEDHRHADEVALEAALTVANEPSLEVHEELAEA